MHWSDTQYRLIDFGDGRKLEYIGGKTIDRPCPAAIYRPCSRERWLSADLRFDQTLGEKSSDLGGWNLSGTEIPSWLVDCGTFQLRLKPTPFGHIGIFPEQMQNWAWITQQLGLRKEHRGLNLFAYTGGTTLALASTGASVTHIDASRPAVQWAKQNAIESHMQNRPVRWIVEDASVFVQRELKRGNQYDFIALDPPSFGHGPKGQRWQLQYDLPQLLMSSIQLLSAKPVGLLLTGHSDDIDLQSIISQAIKYSGVELQGQWSIERSEIRSESNEDLDCGYRVRWLAGEALDSNDMTNA